MAKVKAHTAYKNKDGVRLPSVTTIIGNQLAWNKNALIAWARREGMAGRDPNKVRDEAAESGTLTHHLVECHIKGVEPDTSDYSQNQIDKAENGYLAYLEWEKLFDPVYISSEMKMVSEAHGFGGTCDLKGELNGELTLFDWKTSKGLYPEMKIQMSAYREMDAEMNPEQESIRHAHILRLDKDTGMFEHHMITEKELDYGWTIFQHLLELHRLQRLWK